MTDSSMPIYDSFDYPLEIQGEVLWNLVERGILDEAQFTDIMARLQENPSVPVRSSNRTIFDAVLADDVDLVVDLLKSEPNCVHTNTSRKRWVPLHFAAADGNERLVRLLLAHGANPNQANAHGKTSLHIATDHGDVRTIRALCEFGADLDVRYRDQTPKERAMKRGFTEAVEILDSLEKSPPTLRIQLLTNGSKA